ncbi:MAG TPA: DUF1330 domain-containing protein [Xanthobacteraceae bacterium]|nr:DUF1330 domain-containing protein [Xanthobacteraceae bacterium]
MHYLVCGTQDPLPAGHPGLRLLADGEMIVLEGPWALGRTVLACVDDEAALASLKPLMENAAGAYAVEGFKAPGQGQAFAIAAHKMRDAEGFRAYAEAIPALLDRFGVRSLARGGTVTPLVGDFVPERGVVLEFPSVGAALDFYTSDVYAPLLELRLRTTDPRFVVLARSGAIDPAIRHAAEAYVQSQPSQSQPSP